MVARHGGKGAQPHDQGRPECGRCRQGLGPEPPDDVPRLKVVRDHDELVRTNWPMQLIDLRVNPWLAGSGPLLLTCMPIALSMTSRAILRASRTQPSSKQRIESAA